ncbi:MAG: hypothetical protein PWQ78_767 [Petrotoga sp.]|nr:hypothetical protein [Petrotoga sp.]
MDKKGKKRGRKKERKKAEWSDLIKERYGHTFTIEDIKYFIRKGAIEGNLAELTEKDLEFLDKLAKVWRDREFYRRGLARFSYKDRLNIVEIARYRTQIDRYLFERIKNVYLEKGKIDYRELLSELSGLFKFELTEERKRFFRERIRLIYLDVKKKLETSGIEKSVKNN